MCKSEAQGSGAAGQTQLLAAAMNSFTNAWLTQTASGLASVFVCCRGTYQSTCIFWCQKRNHLLCAAVSTQAIPIVRKNASRSTLSSQNPLGYMQPLRAVDMQHLYLHTQQYNSDCNCNSALSCR